MKDYIQKIKTFYEKLSAGRVSYEKVGPRPSRDWRVMLSVAFFAICFSAFFAIYFYLKINNGEMFVIENNTMESEVQIDKVLLKKVVAEIKNKEDFLKQLKQGSLIPSDPSI